MKAFLCICSLVLCCALFNIGQASSDELTDEQLKGLISTLYKILQREEEEKLPFALPAFNRGWDGSGRHAAAKRVLGSGNLDFVNSDDVRMAVGGSGRKGLGSLGKKK